MFVIALSILQAWYGGNKTGNAIADVFYGDINPSGTLPLTFPIQLEDNPAYLNFGSEKGRTLYGEDAYVGYRWYESIKPMCAFHSVMSSPILTLLLPTWRSMSWKMMIDSPLQSWYRILEIAVALIQSKFMSRRTILLSKVPWKTPRDIVRSPWFQARGRRLKLFSVSSMRPASGMS